MPPRVAASAKRLRASVPAPGPATAAPASKKKSAARPVLAELSVSRFFHSHEVIYRVGCRKLGSEGLDIFESYAAMEGMGRDVGEFTEWLDENKQEIHDGYSYRCGTEISQYAQAFPKEEDDAPEDDDSSEGEGGWTREFAGGIDDTRSDVVAYKRTLLRMPPTPESCSFAVNFLRTRSRVYAAQEAQHSHSSDGLILVACDVRLLLLEQVMTAPVRCDTYEEVNSKVVTREGAKLPTAWTDERREEFADAVAAHRKAHLRDYEHAEGLIALWLASPMVVK